MLTNVKQLRSGDLIKVNDDIGIFLFATKNRSEHYSSQWFARVYVIAQMGIETISMSWDYATFYKIEADD